jgi:hypothetical protein
MTELLVKLRWFAKNKRKMFKETNVKHQFDTNFVLKYIDSIKKLVKSQELVI